MDVLGHIDFLADSPLHEKEKPFALTLPADYESPKDVQLTNLRLDERLLTIHDMRRSVADFTLDAAGFMLVQQPTRFLEIEDMTIFEAYKKETEQILQSLLEPELVVCWDACVSKRSLQSGDVTNPCVGRLRKAARLQQNIEIEDLKDRLTGSHPLNLAHTDETGRQWP